MQSHFRAAWCRMLQSRGASLSAYGLMVGLVAVLALGATTTIGSNVLSLFTTVGQNTAQIAAAGPSPDTADTTPDAFSFSPVENANTDTQYLSDSITITGVDGPVEVSLASADGASYRLNNTGPWGNAPQQAANGDTIQLRMVSSDLEGLVTTASLQAGTVSATWTITTGDLTPDLVSFTPVAGAGLSTLTYSNSVTITGISAPVSISISGQGGPRYEKNGSGSWVSAAGTVQNGDSLRLRLTTATTQETTYTASVRFNNGSPIDWAVTSVDSTPDAISFTPVTNAALSTQYTSNAVTISGIDGTVPIAISGTGGAQYSIDGGSFTTAAGSISAGQSLQLRVTTGTGYYALSRASITVGSASANYDVRTLATLRSALVPGNISYITQRDGITAQCLLWNGSYCRHTRLIYGDNDMNGGCNNQPDARALFCYVATGNTGVIGTSDGSCPTGKYYSAGACSQSTVILPKTGGMPYDLRVGNGTANCSSDDAVDCAGW